MTTSLHRLFVYGTLRRGQPNHHLLLDQSNGLGKWLGVARLVKKYPLVVATCYNIPALLDKEGEGKVNFLSSEYLDYSIASYTFVSIINDYFNLHVTVLPKIGILSKY